MKIGPIKNKKRLLRRGTLVSLSLLLTMCFTMPGSRTYSLAAEERLNKALRGISMVDDLPLACEGIGSLPSNVPPEWKEVLTRAASSKKTSVTLLAAIYLTENGNQWRPFDYPWASSPAGAVGPFQFLPGTWDGHKADGDGDGQMDVMNVWDAAYAAADMIADIGAEPETELGDVNKPLTRDTLLYVAVAYNAGPGFAERSDPNMGLNELGTETREYAMNVHTLISSGFTKSGKPGYADPHSVIDGSEPTEEQEAPPLLSGCSAGGATAMVEMGLHLAWDTPGHGKNQSDAKPTYLEVMPEVNGSDQDGDADVWSDCGVFVATVVLATGVDPDYPRRGTYNQMPYLEGSQDKFTLINDINDTSQLQEGDILIFDTYPGGPGHTYIHIGDNGPDGYTSVGASFHDHVPEVGGTYLFQGSYHFSVARLN